MAPTFEDYVAGRGQALVRLAFLLCADRHLAEDLTQDTLFRAHRRWKRLSALDHPDAYVRRILLNEYLSWRRRRSSTELPVGPGEQGPAAGSVVEDTSDGLAARDVAWRLLATLPRRQRAVLVLRFYEDLSDQQIAEVMGCAAATVRSQAARALATLRTAPGLGTLVHTRASTTEGARP